MGAVWASFCGALDFCWNGFHALSESDWIRFSLALAAQTAEQVYAGTICGIMDHLTATLGKRRKRC